MTRQEKEVSILAECERVTKGYDTPRGSGFVTIQRYGGKKPRYYMVRWLHTNGGELCAMVEPGRLENIQNIDMLYLLLGLETRTLEEEIKRLRDGITEIAESKWTSIYPAQPLMDLLSPPTP